MSDEIERRLRADAARQLVLDAPPLAPAIARAAKRGGRPVVASLAVAASVVLVGGVAAVLANGSSGGGNGSAAGDPTGYRLRGLLQENSIDQPDVVTVLLDVGTCAAGAGTTDTVGASGIGDPDRGPHRRCGVEHPVGRGRPHPDQRHRHAGRRRTDSGDHPGEGA
jgi:hypothetical protein